MTSQEPRAIDLAPLAESVGKLNRAFDELAALTTPGGHREPNLYEIDAAQARLDAVLGLHRPRRPIPVPGRSNDPVCDTCDETYPCETAKAAGAGK